MKEFRISLAGDLGSGKTTVAKILQDKYGAERISAGIIQRDMAKSLGLDITQFNKYMETHPDIDRELDRGIAGYDKIPGNFIFDSRLAFHFVPSAVSFYMSVDKTVAAKRIFSESRLDEGYGSVEEAERILSERRRSEVLRYKEFYDLDILDMSNYDYVIDTTDLTVSQTVEKIEQCFTMGKRK
ncbi:MAG: AAA family ATPase [Christensenellaceae bacterium]